MDLDSQGEATNPTAGLLPHMLRLRNLLNRAALYEHATEAAQVTLERPAMTILVILYSADRPLRVGEIANRMQVVGPHVTRQLNNLEKRALVKRVPDPDDQRARLIALTPSALRLVERYTAVVNGWFAAALTDWPATDRAELVRLMDRLTTDLSAQLDAVAPEATPSQDEL